MTSHRIALSLTLALALSSACASNDDHDIPSPDGDVVEPADAGPPKAFGESCAASVECAEGFCAAGVCSVGCDPGDISSCVNYDAMCVPLVATIPGMCFGGPLSLGDDVDDNRAVDVGGAFAQALDVGDTDLLKLMTDPAGGALWLEVQPAEDVDVAFDVYTNLGALSLTVDEAAAGEMERAELTPDVPAPELFVVVRNAGDVAGTYSVKWACNLSEC